MAMEKNGGKRSLLTALAICLCFTIVNVNGGHMKLKEKVTHLEFYMHDIVIGKNVTAVQVVPEKPVNFSSGVPSFGSVFVMDDPLTQTPQRESEVVGRAQGIYTLASQGEMSLFMALTYSMERGEYKGSSLSVVGKNMIMNGKREFPIVGGSGTSGWQGAMHLPTPILSMAPMQLLGIMSQFSIMGIRPIGTCF